MLICHIFVQEYTFAQKIVIFCPDGAPWTPPAFLNATSYTFDSKLARYNAKIIR